jgi:hypothetical protein
MVFCQSFKACADIPKLINFVQDGFKRHDFAPFTGAKRRKTSDGLLSSEDLKEEKVVTTSLPSIHPGKRARGPSGRSDDEFNHNLAHQRLPVMSNSDQTCAAWVANMRRVGVCRI